MRDLHFLHAENNSDYLRSFSRAVSQALFNAIGRKPVWHTCESVRETTQLLRQKRGRLVFDAAFLDIDLGNRTALNLDGIGLAKKIHDDGSAKSIFIVSGFTREWEQDIGRFVQATENPETHVFQKGSRKELIDWLGEIVFPAILREEFDAS